MTNVDETVVELDALVIGAGFSGLYALHRLRTTSGLDVRAVEASAGVGGTWFTNRYPGARCDTESFVYCYSFSRELREEWRWSAKYPAQEELLRYLEHVTDRFDLRRSIDFGRRVLGASYDAERARWRVRTDTGVTYDCQFLVSAMGVLSAVPYTPTLPGIDDFEGRWVHTGAWPAEGIDLAGKRVAVIGTGSTGVRAARHRPPGRAPVRAPALAAVHDPRAACPGRRRDLRQHPGGVRRHLAHRPQLGRRLPLAAQRAVGAGRLRRGAQRHARGLWAEGGLKFVFGSYRDLITDLDANARVAAFVRAKIRERVGDPELSAKLVPTDHPFGSRRPIVDTDYFETTHATTSHCSTSARSRS